MPVSFHDVGDVDELGLAGFLKLEMLGTPSPTGAIAGLLVVNARGEPLEFAFNRLELSQPFLWGERLARRHLERRLIASLLSVCSHDPRLLVCLEQEIHAGLFDHDLRVEVPIVRVAATEASPRRLDPDTGEVFDEQPREVSVAWLPAPSAEDSAERRLFDQLAAHGLLMEPFERASSGLREVYAASPRPAFA